MSATPDRPITLLIAALGGEGGGVLTDWIVKAAANAGYPVQSTSIPGVAQRTGATTYYIEIVPATWRALNGRRPILSLTPGVGDIDIMAATELLEAGRAIANGFVTRERTMLVGSTGRSYLTTEKMAMGDGRYDLERLLLAVNDNAHDNLLMDMEALARTNGTMISSVMLGAIAGCGKLPIPPEAFETAIRAEGKAAEANLRGFRAGLAAAREQAPVVKPREPKRRSRLTLAELEHEATDGTPEDAREVMLEGVRRLAAYQNLRYARLYLDRLAFLKRADPALLRETARHLAVRMSFEDVIRVAEAKAAPDRFARIARDELKIGSTQPGTQPYVIYDFLKPGIDELCQVLPPAIARPILRLAERRGWLGRVYFQMEVNATSVSGYLRFWALAKLKRWRPRSYRYQQEQTAIEAWLALIREAAPLSNDLAREIAECARLIKGYGDTHARGSVNYRSIETQIIRPTLAGTIPLKTGIDAVASARAAALVDPDGESLTRCLAAIGAQPASQAAE
jgi:indolepyruvate ferredoxin oxidoreductase beta subunit